MQLQSLGINPDSIRFENLTMESDKFIALKDGGQTVIVDMSAGNGIMRKPISADSAIMNPAAKVLALRIGTAMKVMDLSMDTTVKQAKLPDEDPIAFWCWLSKTMLAVVTNNSVYHWSMEGKIIITYRICYTMPTYLCQ